MGSQIQYWSTTPGSNQNSDPDIFSADSQSPATVDDNIRSIMAGLAKYHKDTDGALVASGTANALTAATNQVLIGAQLTGGLGLMIKAVNANTAAAVTFAPDGLTPQPIKRADGSALVIGSIQPNMLLNLVYNIATNEWWAINIHPVAPGLTGVTDGSDAAAGQIGEYQTASAGPYGVPSNVATSVCQLMLTAGDWDVWGQVQFNISGGSVGSVAASINTASVMNGATQSTIGAGSTGNIGAASMVPAMMRVSSATPTQMYLVAYSYYSAGPTVTGQGALYARRVR
jgi:hypothetical protein